MNAKITTKELAERVSAADGPLAGYDAAHALKFTENALLQVNHGASGPQIDILEPVSPGDASRIVDRLWSNPPVGPEPMLCLAAMTVISLHDKVKDHPDDQAARQRLLGAKDVYDAITGRDMAGGVNEWYEPEWSEDDAAIEDTVRDAEHMNAEVFAWVAWSTTVRPRH